MAKLLSKTGNTYGVFPEKDEMTNNPVKLEELGDGFVMDILGAIKFSTEFGDSAIIWTLGEDNVKRKVFLTKTASNVLLPVLDEMEYPYRCVVCTGMSEKYKKTWWSVEDIE